MCLFVCVLFIKSCRKTIRKESSHRNHYHVKIVRAFMGIWGTKNLSSSFTVISVTLTLLGMFECLKYDIRRELSVQIAIAVSFTCAIYLIVFAAFIPLYLSLSASLFLVLVLGISTPLHRFPAKQQLFYLITLLLLLLLFVIRVL